VGYNSTCKEERVATRLPLILPNTNSASLAMRPGVYQFLVGCFASLGSFLFGYDLAVIAEVVASDSFKSLFLQQNANSRSGTVVALFTAGCFFGAFGAGFTDKLGRRGTILMASCIFVVGGIIQTAGVVIGMLYAGRFMCVVHLLAPRGPKLISEGSAGFGVGFLTMIIPIYQAEITHRRIRGKVTSLQQLFNAVGQIFASWIGYGCYQKWAGTGDSREWRIPLAIQVIPALFLGSLIYMFPEVCSRSEVSVVAGCTDTIAESTVAVRPRSSGRGSPQPRSSPCARRHHGTVCGS
jgi:MFS family permease